LCLLQLSCLPQIFSHGGHWSPQHFKKGYWLIRLYTFKMLACSYTFLLHACLPQSRICLHLVSHANSLEQGNSFSCRPQRHFFLVLIGHCKKHISLENRFASLVAILRKCKVHDDNAGCKCAGHRTKVFGTYRHRFPLSHYRVLPGSTELGNHK